jgi:hypothetical protein
MNTSPSPNKYNVVSDFDLTRKNLSMGKMALGREVIFNLNAENKVQWNLLR